VTGEVSALTWNGVNPPTNALLTVEPGIPSFGVDKNGELFIASFDGNIYRLFATATAVDTPAIAGALKIGPNPFGTSTHVAVSLTAPARVDLSVYDVAGRRVATLMNAQSAAGSHEVNWNGRDESGRTLASGVYFVRLNLNGQTVETRRITMIK